MADGRHLGKIEKSPYLRKGLTDLRETWPDDSSWASEQDWKLKYPTFKIPRWRTAAILKIEKSPYLGSGLSDFDKIWNTDAIRRS